MKTKLPNFLCVGAQKAGTTTLHDILIQDSQIYLPEIKETKFFQLNSKYKQGIDFYKEQFFNNVKENQTIGEIDPDYMYFDYVPKRIYETLGADVKFIFILRNPIKRALSHYQMSIRRGYETLEFEEAIANEPDRIKNDDSQEEFYKSKTHNFSYIDRGFYSKQIKNYMKYFSEDNMLFILFEEEFLKNKQNTIENIYNFLNLAMPINLNTNLKSNQKSIYRFKFITDLIYKPNFLKKFARIFIPKKTRDKLIKKLDFMNQKKLDNDKKIPKKNLKFLLEKYYKKEIVEIEGLINKKLDSWYE